MLRYVPRRRDGGPLGRYARDKTSQFGEDGVIEEILNRIGPRSKYCVEFGAGSGLSLSNTWTLLNEKKWSGTLIEAHGDHHAILSDRYKDRPDVHCLHRFIATDAGPGSIDSILNETGAPKDIDVMSIDVDGTDWHIWNSLTEHRPRVVIVECNPNVPSEIVYVQCKDTAVSAGSSAAAFVELGFEKGYELAWAGGVNLIFVARDDFPKLGIADNRLEIIADFEKLQNKCFNLYNGTFFVVGAARLLWSDRRIEDQKMVVMQLPGFSEIGF